MKRGQVTIFVILGIVILLAAGFFLYLNYQKQTTVITPERTTVSEQFKPIQLFVEDCMSSVAREAIEKLGKHGGYIDPSDAYLSGRLFYTNINDPSKSDLYYLSNDPDKAVAYWYYSYDYSGCDDCLIMSQAPYLDEIERQISIYVSENIDSCLENFETFKNQGYDLTADEAMYVKTTLQDNDVLIEASYPINLTYQNSQASMSQYISTVDIPLMKYYDMAINISSQEYNSQFLEGLNTYLILTHSGLDSSLLPPFYSYSNGYNVVYWSESGVKTNMERLLTSYVPLMQVKGSKDYRPITRNLTLMERNFIDSITLDLFPDKNLEKTDISFTYTGQDLSFGVSPSNNGLLGPYQDTSEGISVAPPKETNTYQFFYDVSYPVLVEITDEYKPGQKYTFIFALESTVKENLALKEWWNESKRPLYFEHDFFDISYNDPLRDTKIVDPDTGVSYQYKERMAQNIFCDESQKVSGDVYLKTYDAETKQPLEGVDVTFGCGNYASCLIGRTTYDNLLDVQSFTGKMPLCVNGYIQLEKLDYQKKIIRLTTTSSKTNLGSLYLEPIKKVNVSVRVYPMTRNAVNIAGSSFTMGFTFPNQSYPVGVNDTIILSIDKITSGLEEPMTQTVILSPQGNNTQIDLVPGRYTIDGQLMVSGGYVIPKECKTVCGGGFIGIGEECESVPKDDIIVNNSMLGGITIDETYPLNVKREYLVSDKTLEIYLILMPPPPCIDEMQEVSRIPELQSKYRSLVMPVFK
jgi:hypothetical protein